jgi:hypothetical protein
MFCGVLAFAVCLPTTNAIIETTGKIKAIVARLFPEGSLVSKMVNGWFEKVDIICCGFAGSFTFTLM